MKLKKEIKTISRQNNNNIETAEYKTAVSFIESRQAPLFVTGQAGTGKSTFIRYLREVIGLDAPVIAPTGVAALNVCGQTIHSFFRIPPALTDPDDLKPLRNRRLFQQLNYLIIDEISMVRADLMDLIDISLRKNTGRENELFGGVQLILVGDMFQLPPVIANKEESGFIYSRYKTPYFLSSFCMNLTKIRITELTKVFRQQDPGFIELLSNIREGNEIAETVSEFNSRCCTCCRADDGIIVLTPDNMTAAHINNSKLSGIRSKEHVYQGIITGKFGSDRLPAPLNLKLKIGTQVMLTKNDLNHRWVNGTIGIVKELSDRFVVVETEEKKLSVNRESWENLQYVYDEKKNKIVSKVTGSYTQFPLIHAWAITIHKSQGKTFEKVHIDLSRGAFAQGQLYVALSRCKTLKGISLQKPIRVNDVKVNPVIKEFYSRIRGS